MRNGSQTEPRPPSRYKDTLRQPVLKCEYSYVTAVSCECRACGKIYFGLERRQSQVLIPLKQRNQVFVHGALH